MAFILTVVWYSVCAGGPRSYKTIVITDTPPPHEVLGQDPYKTVVVRDTPPPHEVLGQDPYMTVVVRDTPPPQNVLGQDPYKTVVITDTLQSGDLFGKDSHRTIVITDTRPPHKSQKGHIATNDSAEIVGGDPTGIPAALGVPPGAPFRFHLGR